MTALATLGVVEHGGDVVDRLLDGQRLGRQVGAGVVVPGHPDAAVLDHDDVESLGRARACASPRYSATEAAPGPPGMITSGCADLRPVRT